MTTTETVKQVTDIVAAGVAVGTVAQIIPSVAGLFTIAWLALRMWESETVKKWTKRQNKPTGWGG